MNKTHESELARFRFFVRSWYVFCVGRLLHTFCTARLNFEHVLTDAYLSRYYIQIFFSVWPGPPGNCFPCRSMFAPEIVQFVCSYGSNMVIFFCDDRDHFFVTSENHDFGPCLRAQKIGSSRAERGSSTSPHTYAHAHGAQDDDRLAGGSGDSCVAYPAQRVDRDNGARMLLAGRPGRAQCRDV